MAARIFLGLVTAFWVVMNVLLWRAEFGSGRTGLSEVPVETVADRMLNAPDASVLVVRHHGNPIGLLRWIPTVTESPLATADASASPEGMVTATGYNLVLDLNLNGTAPSERWRVLMQVELDTNRVWQEISIRLFQRPVSWEITTRAGEERVRVRFEEGRTSWEQSFSASDLRQVGGLLGPVAAFLPASLTTQLSTWTPDQWKSALHWQARNDWMTVGRNRVRVYRVQATVLGKYEVVVQLSRAGEILSVRLPDALLLSNEALPSMAAE